MDVRRGGERILALAHAADDVAFRNTGAARDVDRAELQQRDGVAVGGLNRQRPTAARDRAGERDGAGRGCTYRVAGGRTDVDAAVLPGRIGVRRHGERPQDGTLDGPRPADRSRNDDQERDRRADRDGERATHETPPS
ncbi:MAG: hypothetical protein ABIR67_06040 [Gaiellaceae bacterium]